MKEAANGGGPQKKSRQVHAGTPRQHRSCPLVRRLFGKDSAL
jgi:hypothetical protein